MPQSTGSPDAASSASGAHRQLSRMIDAGRAFSGNERNCVFYNTRDGKFATFSAGSGLDFPDDGRALAMTDWDRDGDLDLWISNRNAPRLRLMRNDSTAGNHFLALHLTGDGIRSNRDAIGARVEVILKNSGDGKRLVTGLRAGEGFLSQSGKALHFGMGKATEIDEVRVRWPDGREDVFRDLEADHRYRIRQGEPDALLIPDLTMTIPEPAPREPVEAAPENVIRVPAITLLRAPAFNLKRRDGSQVDVGDGGYRLVNLWAGWCAPCLAELTEFRDRASDLKKAGVEVLAVNVDGLGEDPSAAGEARKFLAGLPFPFPSTEASVPLLETLQGFHDSLVGLRIPMPVPTSFLIDPQGRLSVLYKGPVPVDRILADLGHSAGSLEERLNRAAAFKGSLISHPVVRRAAREQESWIQGRFGKAMTEAKDTDTAIYHYSEALALDPGSAASARNMGMLHLAKGEREAAIGALETALRLQVQDPEGHFILARLLSPTARKSEAREHFRLSLEQDPDNAPAHFGFGTLLESLDEPAGAVTHYRKCLALQPDHHPAKNNLAWLLATSPENSVRDSGAAVLLARELNDATGNRFANILDTLGVAEAGVGNFKKAISVSRQAMKQAMAEGNQALAADLAARVKSYQSKRPYR